MKRTRRNPSIRTMSDSELDSTIRGLSASLPKSVVRDVAKACGWSAGFMLMPSRAEMESFASKLTVAHARRLADEIHEARTTKSGSDERAEGMKWKAWQNSRTENPRRNPRSKGYADVYAGDDVDFKSPPDFAGYTIGRVLGFEDGRVTIAVLKWGEPDPAHVYNVPTSHIKGLVPAGVVDAQRARKPKANPSGHGIVYLTPGNGPASRVRAGNDGRFYVEDYTGSPMSSGWAMASYHGTLAAAIERAKDSAAAMRGARRNPAKRRKANPSPVLAALRALKDGDTFTAALDNGRSATYRVTRASLYNAVRAENTTNGATVTLDEDSGGVVVVSASGVRGVESIRRVNPARNPNEIERAYGATDRPLTSRMKAANYRKAARALDRMAANSERELSPTHATVLSIRAEAADWRRKADLLDKLGARKNPARRRKTGAKRKAFQAQSILLDKDTFTLARAREWLKRNGKKYGKITEGDADWHAEQHPAGDYQPTRKGGYGGFHTIQLGKHVQAIVGIPQRGSDAAEAAGYNTKGPGLFGNRKASGPATVADYNADDVLY